MNKKILLIAALSGAGMVMAILYKDKQNDVDVSSTAVHAYVENPSVPERSTGPHLQARTPSLNTKDEIAALINEGSGVALLEAHRIVARCIRESYFARKLGGKPSDKTCSEISTAYGNSYLQWLDKAIAAETVGAAAAFLEAGPFGDVDSLETRGTDPLVVAWKSKAIDLLERDARARDVQAALSLYEQYRNGAITEIAISKAFGSLVVAKELLVAEGNKKMQEAAQKELDRLSKQLDQEKMAEAYKYVNYLKQKNGS